MCSNLTGCLSLTILNVHHIRQENNGTMRVHSTMPIIATIEDWMFRFFRGFHNSENWESQYELLAKHFLPMNDNQTHLRLVFELSIPFQTTTMTKYTNHLMMRAMLNLFLLHVIS